MAKLVDVREAASASRFSLRTGAPSAGLSDTMLSAAHDGARWSLRLGPDEWLLIGPAGDQGPVGLAEPFSLVDVSSRSVGFEVSGVAVVDALEAGCPLDLSLTSFPVGMCTRTLFGKIEIVLWRTAEDTFRVEVWRSYAPYLTEHLRQAIADL
jgi:sarcosine oxidase subunit gamma